MVDLEPRRLRPTDENEIQTQNDFENYLREQNTTRAETQLERLLKCDRKDYDLYDSNPLMLGVVSVVKRRLQGSQYRESRADATADVHINLMKKLREWRTEHQDASREGQNLPVPHTHICLYAKTCARYAGHSYYGAAMDTLDNHGNLIGDLSPERQVLTKEELYSVLNLLDTLQGMKFAAFAFNTLWDYYDDMTRRNILTVRELAIQAGITNEQEIEDFHTLWEETPEPWKDEMIAQLYEATIKANDEKDEIKRRKMRAAAIAAKRLNARMELLERRHYCIRDEDLKGIWGHLREINDFQARVFLLHHLYSHYSFLSLLVRRNLHFEEELLTLDKVAQRLKCSQEMLSRMAKKAGVQDSVAPDQIAFVLQALLPRMPLMIAEIAEILRFQEHNVKGIYDNTWNGLKQRLPERFV